MKINNKCMALALGILMASGARADLIDYGNGMVYDNVANLTWLKDANLAMSSGYDADGLMTWAEAQVWAASLSVGGVSGWRLPTVTPVNGSSFNFDYSEDGSTDSGINIAGLNSELGHMYYANLGNSAAGGLTNSGPFTNLQNFAYWSGTANPSYTDEALHFFTAFGDQGSSPQVSEYYGWAVHSGNVAAIPEPQSAALLLTGLGLLAYRRRQKTRD